MKRTATIPGLLVLAIVIVNQASQAFTVYTSQSKCTPESVASDSTPPFKAGRVTHSAPNYPPKVVIYVSVEPKYFTRDDMVALAGQLNKSYCAEKRFVVIILDDYDALLHSSPIFNAEQYLAARRGYYENDRTTGKESIRFSRKRGKPIDEVKIDLGKHTI